MNEEVNVSAGGGVSVRQLVEPLQRATFWMKLIGVMMVILGFLIALSIVGIIVAWIPVWAGVLIFQAAGAVDQAYRDNGEGEAIRAMQKLKTFFTIFGVLTLIQVALMLLGVLFGGMGAMMGMGHGPGAF